MPSCVACVRTGTDPTRDPPEPRTPVSCSDIRRIVASGHDILRYECLIRRGTAVMVGMVQQSARRLGREVGAGCGRSIVLSIGIRFVSPVLATTEHSVQCPTRRHITSHDKLLSTERRRIPDRRGPDRGITRAHTGPARRTPLDSAATRVPRARRTHVIHCTEVKSRAHVVLQSVLRN